MPPHRYILPPEMQARARRDLVASKIAAERESIATGGSFVSAPREYIHVETRTREERLAVWEAMLVDLDKELGVEV
jgi:hypothetical protein